jgi:hypothetical protein
MRDSESAARGQKIMQETAPDRGSVKADREALHGRSFKGGPEDLSHSMNPNKYGKMAPKGGNR